MNEIKMTNNCKQKTLAEPKILNLLVNCLKSIHKQQENKKKNYKKLMNLFSVRVQKYEDSSSHNKTDEKFKIRKSELGNKIIKKKKSLNTGTQNKIITNIRSNKKEYDSSNMEINNLYQNYNTIINNQVEIESVNEDENNSEIGIECNSDSSIFTHHKENGTYFDSEEEEDYPNSRKRKTKSMNRSKNILNERAKFIKHKFNKQIEDVKSKKFINEDKIKFSNSNCQNKNMNYLRVNNTYNINIDTSMYNSYKSVNSNDIKSNTKLSEKLVNYIINNIEDEKDLVFYNGEDLNNNKIKYDENYKCYYSLDHQSRIIYIKPSPTLLSSISSILNSNIISKRATQNISNEESVNSSLTPKVVDDLNLNINKNLSLNILNFNHNKIIEKLKNLELLRKDKDNDINKIVVSSSQESNEDDSENIN